MRKRVLSIFLVIIMLGTGLFGCSNLSADDNMTLSKQLDLGYKYIEEGKYEEAILAFENAISIDEKSIEARIGLADVYVKTSDFEMAEEVINEAMAIEENFSNVELWDLMILIYEKSGKDKNEISEIYAEAFKKTGSEKYLN